MNTEIATNLHFDKKFFECEYKDNFYIARKMKCLWAAQMEVLAEIDKICKRHNITYFAFCGTLLGAIRHKGYIPWDDDIDIAMKRKDYQQFIAIAQKELPEGYLVWNPYSSETFNESFSRVVNNGGYTTTKEHMDKFHGCPFSAGVDLFPLDYVPRDKGEETVQVELLKALYIPVRNDKSDPEYDSWISQVEELCKVKINREGNIDQQLYRLIDAVCQLYAEEECDRISPMVWRIQHENWIFKKEWFDEVIQMPFENMLVSVPKEYDKILSSMYGDYMTPVRGTQAHDYPCYKRQENEVQMKIFNRVIPNIQKWLSGIMGVDENAIKEMEMLKYGWINTTYRFECENKKYVLRIPNTSTGRMVNRMRECEVYLALENSGIGDEVIYIESDTGNRVAQYVDNAKACDAYDEDDVKSCMQALREYHGQGIQVEHCFDIFAQIEYYQYLWNGTGSIFEDYNTTKDNVYILKEYVDKQPKQWGLTHMDTSPDNFLIYFDCDENKKVKLIDWEYAGMQDVHLDIARFAIGAMYDKEAIDKLIDAYFVEEVSLDTRRKVYAYIAILGLLQSNLCELKYKNGEEMEEYGFKCYQYAKDYFRIWKEACNADSVDGR